MNDIEDRKQTQGQTSIPGSNDNGSHVPAPISVYDRPERKGPALWLLIVLALLLLVAAVVIYQLVF